MSALRPILAATVTRAKTRDTLEFVSPNDFVVRAWEAPNPRSDLSAAAVPYCIDFVGQRTVYAICPDIAAARSSPFLYGFLRANTDRILSVPWESREYPQRRRADDGQPVFVFSPGRCGSTLLTGLLRASDAPTLSEPDFHSQTIVAISRGAVSAHAGSALRGLLAALTGDLMAVSYPGASRVVIKLRSQCCLDPRLVVSARRPKAATLFVVRRFEPWVRSAISAFGFTPEGAVEHFITALRCYGFLQRVTDCHLIRYEDMVSRPAGLAGPLGTALGTPIAAATLRAALAESTDSQAGTVLARDIVGARLVNESAIAAALAAWRRRRPARLLAMTGLEDIG